MKSKVEIFGRAKKQYKILAQQVALKVIELMNQPDILEVAINFVSETEIKRLNNEFRGKNKVTDVLSFPATELQVGEVLNMDDYLIFKNESGLIHFGDMALCLVQMEKQAKDYNVSNMSELKKLIIHSMLHFMGYDHIQDEDYLIMSRVEKELDEKIKLEVYDEI